MPSPLPLLRNGPLPSPASKRGRGGERAAPVPDSDSRLPDPRSLTLRHEAVLPVAVVTGFLGSGKTTLIRRFLAGKVAAHTAGIAVIVNEFGEIGLDHLLLEHAADDVVLLPGGCLCCQARNDIVRALRTLADRRERRELPHYARIVIETSGLAEPGPILETFL